MHILDWFAYFISAEWVDRVDSKMIYERKQGSQALYVLPITHDARPVKAPLGPRWRHGNLSAQHVRRVGRVSRGVMWLRAGQGRWVQMVVRQLVGNDLGIPDVARVSAENIRLVMDRAYMQKYAIKSMHKYARNMQ